MEINGLLINDIYRATEGEGVFIGRPQIFVRFQGCAVGCINCDSKDTWDFTGPELDLETVYEEITQESKGNIKWISITGGDPLHPKHVPHVLKLTKFLKEKGHLVNIEAAGTRIVTDVFNELDYISYDLKTPSTGVRTRVSLISDMAKNYAGKFQIKAVISSQEDFDYTYQAYQEVLTSLGSIDFPWILTPSYEPGEQFPLDRFKKVQLLNEDLGGPFRVIGQQHKWIYGADKKSV